MKLIKILIIGTLLSTLGYAKHKDPLAVIIKKTHKSKLTHGVITEAKKFLGIRYKFGGTNKRGIDCSAFTKSVMKKSKNKNIPRTAQQQATVGKHVKKKNLRPGDLVFFKNTYKKGISHVGIYLGHNKFIHASSGAKKVTISNLNKKYYKQHYAGARRV